MAATLWFAVLVVVLSPITAAAVARITGDEPIPAIATIADLLDGELPKLAPQEIGEDASIETVVVRAYFLLSTGLDP